MDVSQSNYIKIYNDKMLPFENLLEKDGSVT